MDRTLGPTAESREEVIIAVSSISAGYADAAISAPRQADVLAAIVAVAYDHGPWKIHTAHHVTQARRTYSHDERVEALEVITRGRAAGYGVGVSGGINEVLAEMQAALHARG